MVRCPMIKAGIRESWRWEDTWRDVAAVCFAGKALGGTLPSAAEALGPPGHRAAWMRQVHSSAVMGASGGENGPADGLWTDRGDLLLTVFTADCVPVLMAAADGRIGAAHAGWRGVAADVVGETLARFESPPEVAWVGPCISGDVYEVSEEVAAQVVAASGPDVARPGSRGRPHLDLAAAVEIQLRRRGVAEVRRVPGCTFAGDDRLWSYRRDGSAAGRNLSLIWRLPSAAGP
ncbi:MAG: polyphenol oxidase family protein [Acidobacteriota bacterium]